MDDAAASSSSRRRWVQWEEVVVSNDRGRRLVHYYLRAAPGGGGGEDRELAVVGRERSPRHMSYAVQGRFLRSLEAAGAGVAAAAAAPSPSRSPASAAADGGPRKWRSRREVVDWLSSLVSGCSNGPASMANRFQSFHGNSYDNDVDFTDVVASKDVSRTSLARKISKDFTWLGPAWYCEKRWKHYRSFCRRGFTISVHNFVYIMSEEKKRLIAYVEDLYEDTNATNMVLVRWFDRVDEIGVELPSDVGDREIFFSFGLQDLNVECIDGLAAVLSSQHFDKFWNGTKHCYWQPYLCRRQIDNDDVKPFDITQLQGYWSQQVFRTMFNQASSLKVRFKLKSGTDSDGDGGQKRKRDAFNDDANPRKCLPSVGLTSDSLKYDLDDNLEKRLFPGCKAEILSQDSGIRGCWFRCIILKRHRDKIKLQYQDLQDADETGNLEEWVLLARIAKTDQLGIRISGRPLVRPHHLQRSKRPSPFDVGTVVDAWWNSGWWEGIVLRQGNDGRLQVYFPGEKRVADFCEDDLRHSLEWVDGKWNPLKERKDLACQLSQTSEHEDGGLISSKLATVTQADTQAPKQESGERLDDKTLGNISRHPKCVLSDLTNVLKFDNLKWRARKRRKSGSKRLSDTSSGSSSLGDLESSPCGSFALLNSAPDEEVCKSSGEQPLFMGVPVTVSNLVLSR